MPKLIVSDIDGTLLQQGETALQPRLFALIHELKQRGILFAPASGRQYHSLRQLFAPVIGDLYVLCENGAEIYPPASEEAQAVPLSITCMDNSLCRQIIDEVLSHPGLEILASGSNMSYLIPRDPYIITLMRDITGNRVTVLSSPDELPHDIIKLAAYCPNGATHYEHLLGDPWRDRFTVAIAGKEWLDFTLANKGTGITALANALNVPLSDVMAFGDNYNDCPMLDVVGHPVIMSSAASELRKRYPVHCDRVEDALEELLRTL